MSAPARSLAARLAHWGAALAAVTAFFTALFMTDTGWNGIGLMDRSLVYAAHKSAGLIVVLISCIWLAVLARRRSGFIAFAQLALALMVLAVAMLGWAGSSAGRYGQSLFGLIAFPEIIPARDAKLAVALYDWHMRLAWAAAALVALHICFALWHLLILRDGRFSAMLRKSK